MTVDEFLRDLDVLTTGMRSAATTGEPERLSSLGHKLCVLLEYGRVMLPSAEPTINQRLDAAEAMATRLESKLG